MAVSVAVLVSIACLESVGSALAGSLPHDVIGLGTVSFDQPAYTVHEDQGSVTITIDRSGDLSQTEHVGYGVKQVTARNLIDFDAIPNTYITMLPYQASYSFQVPIIDSSISAPATSVQAQAYLYGAYPDPVAAVSTAPINILYDDPLAPRDAANPLGLAPAPVNGNLLAGAKLFVDPNSPAASAETQYASSNPTWAPLLGRIASQPGAYRFYMWNLSLPSVEPTVVRWLQSAENYQPGTTVMLSSYNLVHGACGSTATPAFQSQYDSYMDQLAAGIGNFHVIYFLELDSLITTPCLNPAELEIRLAELNYAVSDLEKDPHVLVYLDGGAADARPANVQAELLRDAGVGQAQGFFLNSTHFDWTKTELHYGEIISELLGGAHFIINTGENGQGPLRPADPATEGNEVLCNPPGRGLGPLSVGQDMALQTGYPNADGFLWFTNPGASAGQCGAGAPPNGVFWPAYAVTLAQNWNDQVTGPATPPPSPTPQSTRPAVHKIKRCHTTHRRKRRHGHWVRVRMRVCKTVTT